MSCWSVWNLWSLVGKSPRGFIDFYYSQDLFIYSSAKCIGYAVSNWPHLSSLHLQSDVRASPEWSRLTLSNQTEVGGELEYNR